MGKSPTLLRGCELISLRVCCVRDLIGIVLDHVYTGKAFCGLRGLIRRGAFQAEDRVLFVHTGGMFELFGAESNYL